MNTGQMGEIQTKMGQASNWAIPRAKWVRSGVKWVPMAIDSRFPSYKNIYWFLLNLT
jgi:hypothetical protein